MLFAKVLKPFNARVLREQGGHSVCKVGELKWKNVWEVEAVICPERLVT